MIYLFNGFPGCGKTTQAKLLAESMNSPHISTSNLIRERLDELDQDQLQKLSSGQLVDSAQVNQMVIDKMEEIGLESRFFIDGFPRGVTQAGLFLDRFQDKIGIAFDLEVEKEELNRRLTRRSQIEDRGDDNPETIDIRFRIYDKINSKTNDFLTSKGVKVVLVDANRDIEEIRLDIKGQIESFESKLR